MYAIVSTILLFIVQFINACYLIKNILVSQFTFDHVAFEESSYILVVEISASFFHNMLREYRQYGFCMMFFKRDLCHFRRNIPFFI